MKIDVVRSVTCAVAILIASTASGQTQVPNTFQSGQPAMAADVNANFSELESAANQNAAEIATNAADVSSNASDITAMGISTQTAIDANTMSMTDLESFADDTEFRVFYLENDMDLVLDRVIPCNDYKVYGCTQSTSGDGTIFVHNFFWGGIYNVIYMTGPLTGPFEVAPGDSNIFAIPTANDADFGNLWVGGSSNLTRPLNPNWSLVLVDDCNNPTVELVRSGEPSSSRMVVNGGNFYRRTAGGTIIDTVDVTGQTYGLINYQTPGNIIEACTLVTDQTGLYDVYSIELKFNTGDAKFSGPWTHQP